MAVAERPRGARRAYRGLLAERGVLGAPDGLEGPNGFLRSLAGISDAPAKWKGDPDVNIILSIMAKPWAMLGDKLPVVAAAKLIHDSGVAADRIRRISITMWRAYAEYPGTAFKGPFERTAQTQASSAFAAAAILAHGELDYDIALHKRADPQILRLVEVTEITPHDGHALDAAVEITLSDSSTVRREALEAPRTLIFQDRKHAMDVLEHRVSAGGSGAARRRAEAIFAALEQNAPLGVRAVVDDLTQPQ
jgi:2-methylcitrate dehydratase PrpD